MAAGRRFSVAVGGATVSRVAVAHRCDTPTHATVPTEVAFGEWRPSYNYMTPTLGGHDDDDDDGGDRHSPNRSGFNAGPQRGYSYVVESNEGGVVGVWWCCRVAN